MILIFCFRHQTYEYRYHLPDNTYDYSIAHKAMKSLYHVLHIIMSDTDIHV